VVNNDLPAKNLKEFMAYARANPGKISYATPNSTSLVGSETSRSPAARHRGDPYKASPQALTDTMSGQVQMYIVDFGSGLSNMKATRCARSASRPRAARRSFPTCRRSLEESRLRPHVVERHPRPAGPAEGVVDASTRGAGGARREGSAGQARAHRLRGEPVEVAGGIPEVLGDQLAHWSRMIKAAGIKARVGVDFAFNADQEAIRDAIAKICARFGDDYWLETRPRRRLPARLPRRLREGRLARHLHARGVRRLGARRSPRRR
jgi:hypothetical protein